MPMADATITELRPSPAKGEAPSRKDRTAAERQRRRRQRKRVTRPVTPSPAVTVTSVTPPITPVTVCTTVAALATVSAGFSITGMTAVFVGAFWPVIGMGVALELGKLSAVAWLGRYGGTPALRAALVVLVAVLMGLNAIG